MDQTLTATERRILKRYINTFNIRFRSPEGASVSTETAVSSMEDEIGSVRKKMEKNYLLRNKAQGAFRLFLTLESFGVVLYRKSGISLSALERTFMKISGVDEEKILDPGTPEDRKSLEILKMVLSQDKPPVIIPLSFADLNIPVFENSIPQKIDPPKNNTQAEKTSPERDETFTGSIPNFNIY